MRTSAFPIGIDVQEFQRLGRAPDAVQTCEALRAEYSRRQLLLGIDRLEQFLIEGDAFGSRSEK